MENQTLEQLVGNGLISIDAGLRIAAESIDDIQGAATHPELKAALKQGQQQSQEWQKRVKTAIQEVGAEGDSDNRLITAHDEVAKKIRDTTPDGDVRDLGIIAAGQLALHYWIASFGTFGAYAEQVGMDQTAKALRQCADEAGEADKQHTELAKRIMSAQEAATA